MIGANDQGLSNSYSADKKDYDRWFVGYYNYENEIEQKSENAFFSEYEPVYLKDRLWQAEQIRKKHQIKKKKIVCNMLAN